MRTDPREACANEGERLLWALIHDGIAHPFMAITAYSRLALQFHDYTSHRAWPRMQPAAGEVALVSSRFGDLRVEEVAPGFYRVDHSKAGHAFVTKAGDAVDAAERAEEWFMALAAEFGGNFSAEP